MLAIEAKANTIRKAKAKGVAPPENELELKVAPAGWQWPVVTESIEVNARAT
jgi:hypothetical protein